MENMALISMAGTDVVKANIIAQRTGDAFAAGYILSLGNELRKRMQQGVISFWFHKKNGALRHAFGTTMPSLAKAHINGRGCSSIKVIVFWDVEKGAWRSAQLQSIIKGTNGNGRVLALPSFYF